MKEKISYYLEIADNFWILSHRLAEYSSKAPYLEEDLACSNTALDLIGTAESIYNEAARIENAGRSGDDLAYRRNEWEYLNCQLCELENTDFAHLMLRQFFWDTYSYYYLTELTKSSDEFLSQVALKALKESSYHLKRSSEWIVRFGQGTAESQRRIHAALAYMWKYTSGLFEETEAALYLTESGVAPTMDVVRKNWKLKTAEVFYLANLKEPPAYTIHFDLKKGKHTESMGHLLAEMQFLTNKYPDAVW